MRRTTSLAATLTAVGLAVLATGCASTSGNAGPVVKRQPVKVAPVAAKPATPLNPKQQLAKAVRASLAAGHAQFRYQFTQSLVDPKRGQNLNPSETLAGVLDFDHNLVTAYDFLANASTNQPQQPDLSLLVAGDRQFQGVTADLLAAVAPWAESKTAPGNAADVQVTQVLQDVKGPVRIAGRSPNYTLYQLQANMSQLFVDQGSSKSDPMVQALAGTTQTERVWVNRDGVVTRVRWTIDPGAARISGVDPAVVKALVITLDFSNYGVGMVVPPHPTELAAS